MSKKVNILSMYLLLYAFIKGYCNDNGCVALIIILLCLILHCVILLTKSFVQFIINKRRKLSGVLNQYKAKIFGTFIIIGITIIITCYHFHYINSNTFCESFSNLLMNIAGAYIALYLTYLLLKPKIEICLPIAQTLDNKLWICVKNKSPFTKLYNIKIELAYYRYIERYHDYDYLNVDMEENSTITMLYPRQQHENIKLKDSFYVFHTQSAFVKRYDGIRCRISATNVVSNIIDIKDKYIAYKDSHGSETIIRGEYIGNKFYSIDKLYELEEIHRIDAIVSFNEIISRVLIPTNNISRLSTHNWEIAHIESEKLLNEYCNLFPSLENITPTIQEFQINLNEFYELITSKKILTPNDRERQFILLKYLKRALSDISNYMSKHLKCQKVK